MPEDVLVCSQCGATWNNDNGEWKSGENPVNRLTLRRIIVNKPQIVADLSRTNAICRICRCEVVFPVSILVDHGQ